MKKDDAPRQTSAGLSRKKSPNRQEILLYEILNSIPDLIFFKDEHGAYRICNKAFTEYVGCPERDILGKNDRELFSTLQDDYELYCEMDAQAIRARRPCSYEDDVTYPDGA